jgi:hypothetical protein
MRVIDDGRLNPLVVISSDEFEAFLRAKADEAGYADRSLCALQITLDDRPLLISPPELVLMVSNIKGSRPSA